MAYIARTAAVSAAFLFAAPALAQERPAPEAEEIVVTGERDIDRQALDFVRSLNPRPPGGQLARFETAVCPVAIGLTLAQKAAVERRLRFVAKSVGIPVGEADCEPNALVMLTQNKSNFLEALRQHRPEYFGDLSSAGIRRIMSAPGPTAAWQLQGQVTARGTPIGRDPVTGIAVNRTTEGSSRLTAAVRPVFEASALVIERGALVGIDTTQLADYAAMRLFARTEPAGVADKSVPTILSIIEAPMGTAIPLTLTTWDVGYLRGLYSSGKNLYAGATRTEIRRSITKELQRIEEGPAAAAPDPGPTSPR